MPISDIMNEFLISILAAFLVTLIITPYAIRYFKFVGLVTTDIHKRGRKLVPYPAGIPIMVGILGGLLVFVFSNVFLTGTSIELVSIFAGMASILIVAFSGLLDDINSVQIREGKYTTGKRGLKAWQKPLLTIPAAFPLMAIMAGDTQMVLPLIGAVDFGLLYPLLIIPIGVLGASNMVNMLGGFNFMQIGMGIIVTGALGLFALTQGSTVAAIILLSGTAALLGAARFNMFPAKILSGDTDPYIIGALIAVGTIVGNIERAALIIAIPFIIQAALKFYSKYKLGQFASDTGVLQKDGSIKSRYGNSIFSWTHLIMRMGRMTERRIVAVMLLIQAFFASLIFLSI
jgi:UDP-N-acetylglucosamine--dolichyl-phosphate N-acetylglucosaminephosphotransferase